MFVNKTHRKTNNHSILLPISVWLHMLINQSSQKMFSFYYQCKCYFPYHLWLLNSSGPSGWMNDIIFFLALFQGETVVIAFFLRGSKEQVGQQLAITTWWHAEEYVERWLQSYIIVTILTNLCMFFSLILKLKERQSITVRIELSLQTTLTLFGLLKFWPVW